MKTKYGDELYTLKDLAIASDIPEPILRDWFRSGDLTEYFTIYQTPKGRRYYKWGQPYDSDILVGNFVYDLGVVK